MVLLDDGAEEAGEVRFRLLETLREYGTEQLTEDEAAALHQHHAAYYLAMGEAAKTRFSRSVRCGKSA